MSEIEIEPPPEPQFAHERGMPKGTVLAYFTCDQRPGETFTYRNIGAMVPGWNTQSVRYHVYRKKPILGLTFERIAKDVACAARPPVKRRYEMENPPWRPRSIFGDQPVREYRPLKHVKVYAARNGITSTNFDEE